LLLDIAENLPIVEAGRRAFYAALPATWLWCRVARRGTATHTRRPPV